MYIVETVIKTAENLRASAWDAREEGGREWGAIVAAAPEGETHVHKLYGHINNHLFDGKLIESKNKKASKKAIRRNFYTVVDLLLLIYNICARIT